MIVLGRIDSISKIEYGKKHRLVITINENYGECVKRGDNVVVDMRKYYGKRQLKSNSYAWKLITEIANVCRTSKEEIYFEMLQRYGQSDLVKMNAKIDASKFFKYYKPFEKYDDGENKYYIVYRGTSEYDKREMAIFIDGIISECEVLGIDTIK